MSTAAAETLTELALLEGEDLLKLGRRARTIGRGQETLDKGWATRTVRANLNGRSGEVEIRTVPLKRGRDGNLHVKHALALAAISAEDIVGTPFARSGLREALNELVVVAREDEHSLNVARRRSRVLGFARFSLTESSFLYRSIERDYELVRRAVRNGETLNGSMGDLVQPRTKGVGGEGAPRTFAFYARPALVEYMLGL